MDRNLRIRMLLEAGDRVTRPLRDIASGSGRAAQALKATRDRLKDLDRAQADVAGFRALKTGLAQTEAQLTEAQQRVARLAREMAQAEAPTKRLTSEFAKAKREAGGLKREHEQQATELQRMRARLGEAGIGTSDLARHERRLRDEIARTNGELQEQSRRLSVADDRARRFGAARESFGKVQNMATGLAAGGAAGIATGAALGAPLMQSVKLAEDYQSRMTDIAQKANLSRSEAEKMGAGLLTAARAANQLPDALQSGVDTLSGFGLDPRQAVAMMTPIGRAATAYKAEIADLSAAAFAANDNLKVPVQQTALVIDIMAEAGKRGAFEIKDMAGAFPSLTAGYQALGKTGVGAVADLAAALQIARKVADAPSAANNLANVIQKIGSPATVKAFEKMGVDLPAALKKMYAEGKTPLEAIAELTNKTLKGDLSKLGYLFEDAQVQQGLRPLIQNMEEYRRIRDAAMQAKGTTNNDFAERMKDSAEKAKALEINAKALGTTLGGQLSPSVDAARARLGAMASWVNNLATRHPRLSKAVMIAAAALAVIFAVLGVGAIAIAAIMGPIAILNAGLIAMGVAGGVASIGLLPIIGTVLLVAAAIAGIIALVYAIYKHWDGITGFFAGIWNGVKATFVGIWTWLSGLPIRFAAFGANLIGGMIRGITGMLGQLKSTIVNAASSAANWFKQKLGIRSPSRVFAGFGGYMMQGLSNGIAAGEDGPVRRIDALSKRVTGALTIGPQSRKVALAIAAGAAMPAVAAPAAGSAGTGAAQRALYAPAPITINIHAAPGQSAEDIAKAVEDALDRRDRQDAAARRSTYADTPDWTD